MCVSKTTGEEFESYIQKVRDAGFTVVQRADWGVLSAYQCDKDEISFYAYYAEGTEEARIVQEKSDTVSLEVFNYTYEAKPGETNDVYLFGVMMDPDGIDFAYNGNTRLNCGQMLFMKLSDDGKKKPVQTQRKTAQSTAGKTAASQTERARAAAKKVTKAPETPMMRMMPQ